LLLLAKGRAKYISQHEHELELKPDMFPFGLRVDVGLYQRLGHTLDDAPGEAFDKVSLEVSHSSHSYHSSHSSHSFSLAFTCITNNNSRVDRSHERLGLHKGAKNLSNFQKRYDTC
jgi:hypothetical protein